MFHQFLPPPNLTVSEWADSERRLSQESSAEPGRWITSRAPHQKEIMNAVNDPQTTKVVAMLPSQTGKTEALLNVVGYYVAYDPSPILIIQPTLDMAETLSKDRIAPMVRDTPALRGKIADSKSRSSGNTMLHKSFPGGHITMCGANSPAGLASRPIRIVLADEVDRYPPSAGTEGDPLMLAAKRTGTFWNRKIIITSTPTIKGVSKVEREYDQSTKEIYCLSCPDCGELQQILRKHLQHIKNDDGALIDVHAHCEKCGAVNDELAWKKSEGHWVARAPHNGVRGFHMNCYVNPWKTWIQCEKDFQIAKLSVETLQVFINTELAETWEEPGERSDHDYLFKRRESYLAEVPNDAVVLTAGIDTQNDRLEMEVVGWAEGFETWNIDYQVFYGDTSQQEIWDTLAKFIEEKRYTHECGAELRIVSACIDSGGHNTQSAYEFVWRNRNKRIYAIKGTGGQGPQLYKKSKAKVDRGGHEVPLFIVGVDEAKLWLKRRLDQLKAGPGFCHFPIDRDLEYFEQLTAEKLVRRKNKGFEELVWEKTRARNEALDCRVYAYIALKILNPVFPALKKNLTPQLKQQAHVIAAPEPVKKPDDPTPTEQHIKERKQKIVRRNQRRGGFVKSW